MRLYTYVLTRDYGFAPNPFHGFCTLATCKSAIRSSAKVGDWIVGSGDMTNYKLSGHLIYAMKVSEMHSFDEYWGDPRFLCKRPVLNGSLKQIHGDNIYHQRQGVWIQADSHHSRDDGSQNSKNVDSDTRTDRVLISTKFVYFGREAIAPSDHLRHFGDANEDVCCTGRGHRVRSHALAAAFEQWLDERGTWGLVGMPLEFERYQRRELQQARPKRSR